MVLLLSILKVQQDKVLELFSKGVSFNLIERAGSYVGKGLSGGIISIKPSKDFDGIPHKIL